MLHTLLVYTHLLASCAALGTLLQADHKLWRWRQTPMNSTMAAQLGEIQLIVSLALLVLWITGLALLVHGYQADGVAYLANQKLWAKGSVVVLLTINGLLLHRFGFPLLERAPFALLPSAARVRLALMGALSMSAWLFAAFLGIARPWNHSMVYAEVMSVFGGLWLLASAGSVTVAWLAAREREANVVSTY